MPTTGHATMLAIQRLAGNRAATALAAPVQASQRFTIEQLDQDSIIETLAHEMVYEDTLSPRQMLKLANLGYRPLPLRHGRYGMQFRGFVDNGTGRERFPVLAFRGTSSLSDVLTDLEAEGVGFRQFLGSLAFIRRDLGRMGGQVDVTGHSLGGALAQMAAARYPANVRRVVTFNAPGIPARMAQALEAYNRGDRRVSSSHYRGEGDVVDDAGAAFTPGEIIEVGAESSSSSTPVVGAHTRFVLYDLQRLRREHPERFASAQVRVSSTRRAARPVEGVRAAVGVRYGGRVRAAAELLEWLNSDNAIRENLANDASFLDGLEFSTKLQMIRTLTGSAPTLDNIRAVATILRSLSASERRLVLVDHFASLFAPLGAGPRLMLRQILVATS